MIMLGQMKRYKDSLKAMQGPILLNKCPSIKLDLCGLMKYASEEIQMLNSIDFVRRWEE